MPKLSVWTIRLALLHFMAGWSVGAALLASRGGLALPAFSWLTLHQFTLLFGWIMQLAFGVAYWMLPTFGRERRRRGFAIGAVVLVNASVVAAALGPVWDGAPIGAFGGLALGALSFAWHAWPRIKEFGAA